MSNRSILGEDSSLADYGLLLYFIYHCDDCHELQTLADEYIGLYKGLKKSKSLYRDNERKTLSDFFCECDAYAPEDDSIWTTEDASMYINSTQLREAAGRTLTQLEVYA